jgi:hypothetical protein
VARTIPLRLLHHHPRPAMRALHTLEGPPAKPHHAAAHADREDDTAPGKRRPAARRKSLQHNRRLDDTLGPYRPFTVPCHCCGAARQSCHSLRSRS